MRKPVGLVVWVTRVAPAALLVIGLAVLIIVQSGASTADRLSKEVTESAALARMVAALDGVSATARDGAELGADASGLVDDFDLAWSELRALIDSDEAEEVDNLATSFAAYLDSLTNQADPAVAETQERTLRQTMLAIQIEENDHLVVSIARINATKNRLRLAVPILLGLAGIVALLTRRLGTRARRLEYLEGVGQARDDLIATVSHELRTPLTAVMGFAYELRDSAHEWSPSEVQSLSGVLADQSAELASLVDDLLVAVRGDASRIPVSLGRVRVGDHISSVLATLRPDGVVFDAEPDLYAEADALRLRQILRNLISNAMQHGGPRIRIEMVMERSGAVHVIIADDGPGVPADLAGELLGPHRRMPQLAGDAGNLALGLGVCLMLAHGMGGDLTYTRNHGWTRFDLELAPTAPRLKQAAESDPMDVGGVAGEPAAMSRGRPTPGQ